VFAIRLLYRAAQATGLAVLVLWSSALSQANSGRLAARDPYWGPTALAYLLSQSETTQSPAQTTRPRRVHPEGKDPKGKPSPTGSNHDKTGAAGSGTPHKTRPKASTTRGSKPTKPVPAADKGFTVQLGAFLDPAKANQLSRQLIEKGYSAEVSTMSDGHKRAWRLVRVGTYTDRNHADAAALEIEQRTGVKGIVRPVGAF